MPSMASLTVKKADTVSDIVYDVVAASGGDGSPALWRQDTAQPSDKPNGVRATLRISTTNNGPKTARQVRIEYAFPDAYEDADGRWVAKDRAVFTGFFTLPNAMNPTNIGEAVAQCFNALASTLVKSAVVGGYAPT